MKKLVMVVKFLRSVREGMEVAERLKSTLRGT